METRFRFVSPPAPCAYLPDRNARYENELVAEMTAAEYFERMSQGWRRFGHFLFRPRCTGCRACQSLRVDVARFRPSRSQRRNRKLNEHTVRRRVGPPEVTPEKLDLYDRYHFYQADEKGWPAHLPKDAAEYYSSFVEHPFPTEEWCYTIDERLVGVGYVDRLPGGLSAIYFFYDPDERGRGLGVWNVLSVIERARELGLPHAYLGYYVEGSESMAYKADYVPNQLLGPDGEWRDFRN
jgi:arginyl-tRNA--protein-N-Asp/Glu arginylyltransferase